MKMLDRFDGGMEFESVDGSRGKERGEDEMGLRWDEDVGWFVFVEGVSDCIVCLVGIENYDLFFWWFCLKCWYLF